MSSGYNLGDEQFLLCKDCNIEMAQGSKTTTDVSSKERGDDVQLHLDKLPLELLIGIFSYLDCRQDLVSCSKVSKVFYDAAVSPSLWKSLCCKVWRISKDQDENWKGCYAEMYMNWGRYEQCYASIRQAWDLVEKYTEEFCPTLLHGLNNGVTEKELNLIEMQNLNGEYFVYQNDQPVYKLGP